MAQRNERECAFCAEELIPEQPIIGQDWKVYCSAACAQRGEELSVAEVSKWMQNISERPLPRTV